MILTLTVLGTVSSGWAQSSDGRGWGYLFGGGGGITDFDDGTGLFQIGGGGDVLLSRGLGASFQLSYAGPAESFEDGFGVFSPGILYSFNEGEKTKPFVTGGYSLFFGSSAEHGVFFGAGVDDWIGNRWGIRAGVRDEVFVQDNIHLITARFGFAFRQQFGRGLRPTARQSDETC